MEHKSTNFRHFNCLSLSVVLHSLIIVGLGLAPAMLLNKGMGDGEGETIEVAVVGDQPAPTVEVAAAPMAEAAPAPIPAPTAAPVVEAKPAPEVKPVAIVKTPKAAKKTVAKEKPIKQTVQPQPAVEVSETLNEQSPVVAQEEQPLPEKEEQKIEETVAPAVVAEEALPPKEEKLPEMAKEELKKEEPIKEEVAPAPTPVVVAEAPKAVEQPKPALSTAAPAHTGTGTATAGGQQGAAPVVATAAAPQNFLSLRQAAGNRPPQYTRDMRLNRLEGRGQLSYYVTKDGQVSQVRLTQSTGSAELDREAVNAFSKYKFVPGQEGHTVHNFEFTLKGPAEADAGRLRTTLSK